MSSAWIDILLHFSMHFSMAPRAWARTDFNSFYMNNKFLGIRRHHASLQRREANNSLTQPSQLWTTWLEMHDNPKGRVVYLCCNQEVSSWTQGPLNKKKSVVGTGKLGTEQVCVEVLAAQLIKSWILEKNLQPPLY